MFLSNLMKQRSNQTLWLFEVQIIVLPAHAHRCNYYLDESLIKCDIDQIDYNSSM